MSSTATWKPTLPGQLRKGSPKNENARNLAGMMQLTMVIGKINTDIRNVPLKLSIQLMMMMMMVVMMMMMIVV
jgi:hypothetical protein